MTLIRVGGQLFSHHEHWECWKTGVYLKRECEQELSAVLLRTPEEFRSACEMVTADWPISAAVHLTNSGINRNAWLGQAACFLRVGVCAECTKAAWWTLNHAEQHIANQIAREHWESYQSWILSRVICRSQKHQLVFPFMTQPSAA